MDKLIQLMEAMKAAFDADPMLEGPWWLWHDGGEGGLCPRLEIHEAAQLAHDLAGNSRRVYLAADVDALGLARSLRGIVLERASYGFVWHVDDGRGLVRRGSARRLIDIVDELWRTAVTMLVNPARVTHAVLKNVVGQRAELQGVGRVSLRPGRVVWAGLEALFGSPEAPWPTVIVGDVPGAVARELVPNAALAHQAAGLLVHLAGPMAQGDEPPRARPYSGAEREIRWQEQWRPGDPPAAMRDAASTAKRSEVDGRWRQRLRLHLQHETDKARARRLKVVEARLQAVVYLPPEGADPTGKEAAGWYGATGADRLPIASEVIAALWILGYGGRTISEMVIGSRSSKSAMSRRIKELMEGRDDLEAVKGATILERLQISSGLEPRPAAAPGAPPGRARTSVKVKRRGRPPFDVYVDQLDDNTASFVCNLPERALRFLSALYQRGEMTSTEALEALDLVVPKALSGLTGSICRWAPVRDVAVPFERVRHDDQTFSYRWLGFPTSIGADQHSQDAA